MSEQAPARHRPESAHQGDRPQRVPMTQVGEFFKQMRQEQGLAIEDIAVKTRIHPDFLRALEDGNFAKLPDQVFVKGFVRSYAQSLGLDEDEALRRFVESAGPFYDKQSDLDRLRRKQAEDERKRQANRKILAAAVGVALLGLLLLLTREQAAVAPPSVSAKVEPESQGSQAGSERPSNLPVQPPGSGSESLGPQGRLRDPSPSEESSSEKTAGQPRDATEHAPDAGTQREALASSPMAGSAPDQTGSNGSHGTPEGALVLDLEAHELSWVVVQVDGEDPQEVLLRHGEHVRWKAVDKLLITLGNAGGVQVKLNGVPQGPFGPSGKVARDILFRR